MTIEEIALDIADESEADVIDNYSQVTVLEGKRWYDLREARHPQAVRRAVAYLNMRGLLVTHPDRGYLVRIPTASELGILTLDIFGAP